MMPPEIHGKGRIMFSGFAIDTVDMDDLREIPGGPDKDEAFIVEGARLLWENPAHDFPYVIAVWDNDERCYWIIEGRHRAESYRRVGTYRLTILRGWGMRVLDKV
jgi:hypothetical protein